MSEVRWPSLQMRARFAVAITLMVSGEAAMFSAQEQIRDDERRLMGMNHPDAEQNPQFLLNVMHWLSGRLD